MGIRRSNRLEVIPAHSIRLYYKSHMTNSGTDIQYTVV